MYFKLFQKSEKIIQNFKQALGNCLNILLLYCTGQIKGLTL